VQIVQFGVLGYPIAERSGWQKRACIIIIGASAASGCGRRKAAVDRFTPDQVAVLWDISV
jgi:hypothetical protein